MPKPDKSHFQIIDGINDINEDLSDEAWFQKMQDDIDSFFDLGEDEAFEWLHAWVDSRGEDHDHTSKLN